MDRRSIIIILSVIILTAAGYYLTLQGPTTDRTLIGADITVHRIAFHGEPTPAADVSVPFTRKDDSYRYANIAIDLNKDSKIAAYRTDAGMQEEWVVRNTRAKVIEGGNAYSFELVDPRAGEMTAMPLVAVLTEDPLEDWDGTVPTGDSAAQQMVLAGFEEEDFGDLYTPYTDEPGFGGQGAMLASHTVPDHAPPKPSSSALPPPEFDVDDPAPFITDTTSTQEGLGGEGEEALGAEPAQDALPPEDADFEVFQPGMPDMNQGRNECVPTSISNGLHWLAERYGFEDRMPEEQDDTMEELKPDLNWHEDRGANMWNDIVPAKVAFTQRHDLPIYTHRISDERYDDDIVRKIAAELRKGQAVDIAIGYYRWDDGAGEWRRNGGHMFSGVGAFSANGQSYLGVHDPLSQDPGRLDMYHVDDSRIYDYRYRGNSAVFIEYAYAQSPLEEWVTEHPPRTDLDVDGMAEGEDLQNTWFVDMIRIGEVWFPVKQFHKFTGDTEEECEMEEHWHANTGQAWGLDLSEHEYFDLNPERIRDRNASVVGWTDPENCGAGKTAEVERGNIMVSRSEALDLLGRIIE